MATGVGRGRIYLTSFNSPTPKTPTMRKHLGDISHTSQVMAHFVPNFVAMATRVCYLNFSNVIRYLVISVIFPIQVKLWPILAQISLPWQPGSVFVKFLWRRSIAWPRKPAVWRNDLSDIYYTSRAIVAFVSNLVTMATGVGRGRIYLTSFNSPTSKTPY